MLFIGVDRQNDHPHLRKCFGQMPGRLESIQFRHRQIHQHYLRLVRFDEPNGLSAITGLSDYFYIREPLEQRTNAGANQLMIVGE